MLATFLPAGQCHQSICLVGGGLTFWLLLPKTQSWTLVSSVIMVQTWSFAEKNRIHTVNNTHDGIGWLYLVVAKVVFQMLMGPLSLKPTAKHQWCLLAASCPIGLNSITCPQRARVMSYKSRNIRVLIVKQAKIHCRTEELKADIV